MTTALIIGVLFVACVIGLTPRTLWRGRKGGGGGEGFGDPGDCGGGDGGGD